MASQTVEDPLEKEFWSEGVHAANISIINFTLPEYSNGSTNSTPAPGQIDTSSQQRMMDLFRIGLGTTLPIICAFGIIGNALSLVILRAKNFSAVMYIYVRWMAGSELIAMILLMAEALNKLRPLQYRSVAEASYFAHVSTPFANAMFGCSSLLVVLMTIERYLSVCHPLKAKVLSTERRAYIFVFLVYLVCFAIYSVMVNDYIVKEMKNADGSVYYIITWNQEYTNNFWYRQIYTWSRAIVIRVAPFIVILTLNIFTVRSYRKIMQKRRNILNRPGGNKKDEKRFQDENNIIIILISTAVVYVLCLAPMPVAYVLSHLYPEKPWKDFGFTVYLVVGNNLEVLNSALNFYMYCLASRDFRNVLRNMCVQCFRCLVGRIRGSRNQSQRKSLTHHNNAAASRDNSLDEAELEPLAKPVTAPANAITNGEVLKNPASL